MTEKIKIIIILTNKFIHFYSNFIIIFINLSIICQLYYYFYQFYVILPNTRIQWKQFQAEFTHITNLCKHISLDTNAIAKMHSLKYLKFMVSSISM